MARIILVRHGKTDWNRELRIQGGSSDTPLNEDGRQQAEKLASRLSQRSIQAIYSSPLKRAMETAQIIACHHNMEVVAEKSLREIEAGKLEGATSAELGVRFSELLTRDGVSYRVPGGESLADLRHFRMSTGCISIINLDEKNARLELFNDTGYLAQFP